MTDLNQKRWEAALVAMQGLLARGWNPSHVHHDGKTYGEALATDSFFIADAMLEEYERRKRVNAPSTGSDAHPSAPPAR